MLRRAGVAGGEHLVVDGASGGVGSAALQLAKGRGASVTAVAGRTKLDQVRAIGADRVVERDDDIVAALGEPLGRCRRRHVSGPALAGLLRVLKRGGRYVSSGAIAGPIVSFDKRTFYLNDLTLIGCTAWDEPVFPAVISAIERGEVRRGRRDVPAREDSRGAAPAPREAARRQLRADPAAGEELRADLRGAFTAVRPGRHVEHLASSRLGRSSRDGATLCRQDRLERLQAASTFSSRLRVAHQPDAHTPCPGPAPRRPARHRSPMPTAPSIGGEPRGVVDPRGSGMGTTI